jgi:D-tyrosyl-tRNA(Tyr) deacylase
VRLVIQRVRSASVSWPSDEADEQRREIGQGVVVLVGVAAADDEGSARRLAEKVRDLRIFPDAEGRTNLGLGDVNGQALVVSQFTLYADLSRGRRPSFVGAGDAAHAERLYRAFAEHLAQRGVPVQTGSFGAAMTVRLENQGPFTLVLSSDDWNTAV